MNPPEKSWLKVVEASSYLSIHPKTLYALLSRGEIAFSKRTGIGIRIHIDRLDEYLREAEVASVREQLEGRG